MTDGVIAFIVIICSVDDDLLYDLQCEKTFASSVNEMYSRTTDSDYLTNVQTCSSAYYSGHTSYTHLSSGC